MNYIEKWKKRMEEQAPLSRGLILQITKILNGHSRYDAEFFEENFQYPACFMLWEVDQESFNVGKKTLTRYVKSAGEKSILDVCTKFEYRGHVIIDHGASFPVFRCCSDFGWFEYYVIPWQANYLKVKTGYRFIRGSI